MVFPHGSAYRAGNLLPFARLGLGLQHSNGCTKKNITVNVSGWSQLSWTRRELVDFVSNNFPHIFTLNRWKSLLKKRKDDTEAAVKVAQEGSGS